MPDAQHCCAVQSPSLAAHPTPLCDDENTEEGNSIINPHSETPESAVEFHHVNLRLGPGIGGDGVERVTFRLALDCGLLRRRSCSQERQDPHPHRKYDS